MKALLAVEGVRRLPRPQKTDEKSPRAAAMIALRGLCRRALGAAAHVSWTSAAPPASRPSFFHASAAAAAARDPKQMPVIREGAKITPKPRGIEPPPTAAEYNAKTQPNFGSGGGGMSPFTPTSQLRKRKTYQKRMKFLMQTLEVEKMREIAKTSPVVPFRPGDVIRVKVEVLENRRRANDFIGICIARVNRGMGSSFTLRSVVANQPIERTFPTYSPTIKEFEIIERRKVRRAKLYYLRDKPLRYSRFEGM
tara:strand:+ start:757 stop:1512 length:756 start_codon:yes stop_codon:yes gene_type:complete